MSLLVNALSIAHYTRMANDAAYSMMKINNSRMNMISSMGKGMFGFTSPDEIAEIDNELEMSALTSSLQYRIAKAMLEQLKKQQKEDIKNSFSTFA